MTSPKVETLKSGARLIILPPAWDSLDLVAWKRSLGEKVITPRSELSMLRARSRAAVKSRQKSTW